MKPEGNVSAGKGGSIVPSTQSEDKVSQGFSTSGIPSKSNAAFQSGEPKDTMGKGQGPESGPTPTRK